MITFEECQEATNGDRSTELTESFLLVYRDLGFDNG